MSSAPDSFAAGVERAGALRDRLAALGLHVDVEASGALAVLRPATVEGGMQPDSVASRRAEVVAAARASGFSHVAVEL